LDLQRFEESFRGGCGVSRPRNTNLLSSVLFNRCSILLGKCVCQQQIAYVYLAYRGFALRPHRDSALGPRWGTSVPQTPCTHRIFKLWLCHCYLVNLCVPLVSAQGRKNLRSASSGVLMVPCTPSRSPYHPVDLCCQWTYDVKVAADSHFTPLIC